MAKTPKNLSEYLDPMISAARLITLAMERIMFAKKGYKVKWEVTIRYYFDPVLCAQDETNGPLVRPSMGKFSSGTLDEEKL